MLNEPRYLIDLLNHCKGFAVNLKHDKIQKEDIIKGLVNYSTDLVSDICLEIRDVYPKAENVLYAFISSKKELKEIEVKSLFLDAGINDDQAQNVIEILLWYGFLGVLHKDHENTYIY